MDKPQKISAMTSETWNNLPIQEKERWSPYLLELQIRHIKQVRERMVDTHRRAIQELDEWIRNMEKVKRRENEALQSTKQDQDWRHTRDMCS